MHVHFSPMKSRINRQALWQKWVKPITPGQNWYPCGVDNYTMPLEAMMHLFHNSLKCVFLFFLLNWPKPSYVNQKYFNIFSRYWKLIDQSLPNWGGGEVKNTLRFCTHSFILCLHERYVACYLSKIFHSELYELMQFVVEREKTLKRTST